VIVIYNKGRLLVAVVETDVPVVVPVDIGRDVVVKPPAVVVPTKPHSK
jgi:hypothetical protein